MSEFENQFSLSLAPNGTSVVAKLGGVYTVSSPRCESKVPADFSLGPSAPCSELGGAGLRRSLNNGISSEKHPSRSRQHPPFVFVKRTNPAGRTLVHTDPGDPHIHGHLVPTASCQTARGSRKSGNDRELEDADSRVRSSSSLGVGG